MKGMLYIFSESDYESLAKGVASMFRDYYQQIQSALDFDTEEGRIAYDNSDSSNITYGETLSRNQLLLYELTSNPSALSGTSELVNTLINNYTVAMIASQIGMATAQMMAPMMDTFSNLGKMMNGDLMQIDTDQFAKAFNFNMNEEELSRLMETMLSPSDEKSYSSNLISLGYQDGDEPTSISFYFRNFDAKENFLAFLDHYNDSVDEDIKLRYTDITGILMSSVKTIVDVVTYVLVAFVSISLVVSSIMIAVITLISVLERTKEIGILRAMGASKHNISSIFHAETFIIGLLSGLLGVGFTFAVIPLINRIIHHLTGNTDVNAVLPGAAAVALILIAVFLTIIAGFIPSKKAARQDPVVALRSE